LDHPRDYELMFLTNCGELGFKRIAREIEERSRPTFTFLVERIEECMTARVMAKADPLKAALFVWSTVHGTASLWLYGQLAESMDLPAFRAHVGVTLDWLQKALEGVRRPPARART
jgi:hypothetical protein